MVKKGLVIRQPDPLDGRRVFVELSPDASGAMHRYLAEVFSAPVI
jgi:DNA-binding MarR family transcriptional regulator